MSVAQSSSGSNFISDFLLNLGCWFKFVHIRAMISVYTFRAVSAVVCTSNRSTSIGSW